MGIEVEEAVLDQIQKIFSLQVCNSRKIRLTSYQERINKLKRLRQVILDHRDQIKHAIYLDFNKSPEEVDLTEIFTVLSEIRYTIKHLKSWMKPIRISNTMATRGARNKAIYQPKGVCLIISPWNYPLQLSIGPLVSAIAAGNCVIIKPSEFSANTSELISSLLQEIFEENEVRVIEGDHRVAQKLLELPFHHVYFTGSPMVGKKVMAAAAVNLVSVTLELGGKSPVIIDENADIAIAARRIMWGKLINAGQTCIAPDYVLIHESKYQEFMEKAKASVQALYGPLEEIRNNPDYCRIINHRHFNRIRAMIDQAVNLGGELEFGGVVSEEDLYISPTLIHRPPLESALMQEEIFGPILPIITYKQTQEILDMIQAKPRPLVLYIFSSNQDFIESVSSNTYSGDVVVNDVLTHYANVKLPFGGVNNSGIGKTHGKYGFAAFSHLRSMMHQGKHTPSSFFYPPYNQKVKKMIDFLLKYM